MIEIKVTKFTTGNNYINCLHICSMMAFMKPERICMRHIKKKIWGGYEL